MTAQVRYSMEKAYRSSSFGQLTMTVIGSSRLSGDGTLSKEALAITRDIVLTDSAGHQARLKERFRRAGVEKIRA